MITVGVLIKTVDEDSWSCRSWMNMDECFEPAREEGGESARISSLTGDLARRNAQRQTRTSTALKIAFVPFTFSCPTVPPAPSVLLESRTNLASAYHSHHIGVWLPRSVLKPERLLMTAGTVAHI